MYVAVLCKYMKTILEDASCISEISINWQHGPHCFFADTTRDLRFENADEG